MLMLIWNNITRRRTQSVLTVTITMLTVMVFVMVMGVFQTVNQGLALSRERLGADAVLIGRPFVISVYGGGKDGVGVYVNKLRSELRDAMEMTGCATLADITRDVVTYG